ncbi:MAG: hypothetical protein U0Y08_08190 [Bacteroidia bacterium]
MRQIREIINVINKRHGGKAGLRLSIIVFIIAGFSSCKQDRTVQPAIYYWKTTFDPAEEEIRKIKSLGINKLYLHFFDVKFEAGNVVPVAKLNVETPMPAVMEVVPVVYITNESLQQTSVAGTDSLAYYIEQLIRAIGENNHILYKEIQIDCDWTDGTKDKYFALLKSIKKLSGKMISCTIRLHQIKYQEKTGIPPADRGMLMFYNMGNLRDPKTTNSIFDQTTAKKYLARGLSYPLELDLALACFRWDVVIRQGKIIALLTTPVADSLISKYTTNINTRIVQVQTGFLHQGTWFQSGDLIRAEKSGLDEMKEAAHLLSDTWKNNNFSCAFYHWHDDFTHNLDASQIDEILDPLR